MKLQAYPLNWAFHTALRNRATRWHRQQLPGIEQLTAIEAAYPLDYYQPVWPLRVAQFIFACVGLVMAAGLSYLVTDYSPLASGILFCTACFGVLERLILKRRFYHSGVDNALLYSGLCAASGLIGYVFFAYFWSDTVNDNNFRFGNIYGAIPLLLVLNLLVAAAIRYADALVTAVALFATLLLVAIVSSQTPLGTALLPFLVMATAGGTLVLQRYLSRRLAGTQLADYYASCLLMLKTLSLAMFYLGGNYLVVHEGNAAIYYLSEPAPIPFALIFYVLTAGIPLVYIVLGLRRADRPTLLVGLLALAFSIFTLRYYRLLMPPEVAAVVAGVLLTVAAGALLRALRPARFGLTSLPDDEPRHFNLENLIQAQTAHAPGSPATGFEFGGGQSGGGGATGQF